MSEQGQQRWAQATYASFGNSRASGGGWRIGPTRGTTEAEQTWLRKHAPTRLIPVESFDDFIGQDAIDQLPRRLEYWPQALGTTDAYLYSVAAGKDATGRPGNVFTHAVFDRDPGAPRACAYPIEWYGAPEWRTPFRFHAVNAVTLEHEGEFSHGPLDPELAWMMVDTMLGDRTGALYALQNAVASGGPVVLLTQNTQEAAFWLYALSLTMSPSEARRIGFSTFDRAESLITRPNCVSCVPVADRGRLRVNCPIVDVSDSAIGAAPVSAWNRLTAAVYGVGRDIAETMFELRRSDVHSGTLGAGLAATVLESPGRFAPEIVALAGTMTDYRPVSVFDDPMCLLREFPADAVVRPGDRERLAEMLALLPQLSLDERTIGQLYALWLEYGVRAGIVSEAEVTASWAPRIAEVDQLFAWLRTPVDLEPFVCAPVFGAAWRCRFALSGTRARQWLGAPGATIHPVNSKQLGFSNAPEPQLRLTDIASRIHYSGPSAASLQEWAILFQEMTKLQRAHHYSIPLGGDELTELWRDVGEGLQETGYQTWFDEHQQGFELLRVISIAEPLRHIVLALQTPRVQRLLQHVPATLEHSREAQRALLRLAVILVPFSQLGKLFSYDAAEESAIRNLIIRALATGVSWEPGQWNAASASEFVSETLWPDFHTVCTEPESVAAALLKLAELPDYYSPMLADVPQLRALLNELATLIVTRKGEPT